MGPQNTQLEIENWILSTWSSLLKRKDLHRECDFFESGGTSLQAMDFVVLLRDELQVEIPTSILLEHGTATALARAILKRHLDDESSSHLHRFGSDAGSKVFCIHGDFSEVVQHLPADEVSLHMMPPHGLDGRIPPATVRDMAEDYLKRIFDVQRHEPYVVAGYSFGGVIAHEAACLMESRGIRIMPPILFDSGIPHASSPDEESLQRLRDFEERIGRDGPLVSRPERHRFFLDGLHRAGLDHEPGQLKESITFLQAADSKSGKPQVWRQHSRGEFRHQFVPGDHFTMLTGDNAVILAERILEILAEYKLLREI